MIKLINFAFQRLHQLETDGNYATDHTDAAYTLCYDLHKRDWSGVVLDSCGVAADKFPRILNSTDIVGYITPEALQACGFDEDECIPVVAGAGDGSASHAARFALKGRCLHLAWKFLMVYGSAG